MRALFISILVSSSVAHAHHHSPSADADLARVLAVRGVAYVVDDTQKLEAPLEPGMIVRPPSTVFTKEDSAVRIRMPDGSIVSLGSSTRLTLNALVVEERKKRRATFRLAVGRVWAKVRGWVGGETEYGVETGNAVLGVRGTEFVVSFNEEGQSTVLVVSGTVQMQDAANELSEKIGPFFAGLFSGEGEILVREITVDELQAAEADVHIGPQLSDEELAALKKKRRLGADAALLGPLMFGLRPEDDPPTPDLLLEPGVGGARVTGRLEVRDD